MIFFKQNSEIISVPEINLTDQFFRISQRGVQEDLLDSLKRQSLIEPLVLKKNENKPFTVIFGFNRLSCLLEIGVPEVEAIVLDEILLDHYLKYVYLKNFRNEIGPVGKLKLILIFKDYFNLDQKEILKIGQKGLNYPVEFVKNEYLLTNFFKFPSELLDYLDQKKISFRLIKALLSLPQSGLKFLTNWIKFTKMRVNVFKQALALIIDIIHRDQTSDQLGKIDLSFFSEETDKRAIEEYLLKRLFVLRYPDYSCWQNKVSEVKKYFLDQGFEIHFPDYFESENIKFSLEMSKGDDFSVIQKKITSLNQIKIKQLLELL